MWAVLYWDLFIERTKCNLLVKCDVLSVADAVCLQNIHIRRGTLSEAMSIVRKTTQTLAELAAAVATSCCSEKGAQNSTKLLHSSGWVHHPTTTTTGRKEKASRASPSSMRGHQSRFGRAAATAENPQWPVVFTIWKHRLQGLEAEHLFSLESLGWTSEGGLLHCNWKQTFLDAVDLLSSLLDRSDEVSVLLKPLRVCASSCLRGVRFLSATIRFLWSCVGNFSAYRWESTNSPSDRPHGFDDAPVVTPSDLQECVERLHRVLAVRRPAPFAPSDEGFECFREVKQRAAAGCQGFSSRVL